MENFENNNDVIDEVVETTEKMPRWTKELIDWVVVIVVALVISFLLSTFVLKFARVQGASMENTLYNNDMLYVNKLMYKPEKGDVVIVKAEDFTPDEPYWVKRVIATEGDTLYINFTTGDVYVNDEIIDEPYIAEKTKLKGKYINELGANYSRENPIVIGEGEVFVMGDNRNHSRDSRNEGPIPVEKIEGHAVFRFWPLSEMTTLDHNYEE